MKGGLQRWGFCTNRAPSASALSSLGPHQILAIFPFNFSTSPHGHQKEASGAVQERLAGWPTSQQWSCSPPGTGSGTSIYNRLTKYGRKEERWALPPTDRSGNRPRRFQEIMSQSIFTVFTFTFNFSLGRLNKKIKKKNHITQYIWLPQEVLSHWCHSFTKYLDLTKVNHIITL